MTESLDSGDPYEGDAYGNRALPGVPITLRNALEKFGGSALADAGLSSAVHIT